MGGRKGQGGAALLVENDAACVLQGFILTRSWLCLHEVARLQCPCASPTLCTDLPPFPQFCTALQAVRYGSSAAVLGQEPRSSIS